MQAFRIFLIVTGVLGGVFFSILFAISLLFPIWIERAAKEIIRTEVTKRVSQKIDVFDQSALIEKAKTLLPDLDRRINRGRAILDTRIEKAIDAVFAKMFDASCDCRRFLKRSVRDAYEREVSLAEQTRSRLGELIQAKYGETTARLMLEFRIFTGTNAALLLLLGVSPLAKRSAKQHLIPVALLVFTTLAICSWLYLFKQDWLHTILFADYVGWTYIAWVGSSLMLFSDLLLNRARVTARVLSNIGGSVSISPC